MAPQNNIICFGDFFKLQKKKKTKNVADCYGTLHLVKSANGTFKGDCRNFSCLWRAACISRSREEMEMREFRLMTVPLGEKLNKLENILSSSGENAGAEWVMKEMGLSEHESFHLREAIEMLAMVYFQMPNIFHLAMRKIFHGETQADVARARKVSREIISRGGLADLAGLKDPLGHIPPELDGIEKLVYEECFIRKLSIRKAAEKLNLSKDKIYRVRQKITSKLTKSATTKK